MSLRGKAAIVGVGELKPMKTPPAGKTGWGLMAEAARMAIEDAGLNKNDIDGMMVESPVTEMSLGPASLLAEYLQIPIKYGGSAMIMGASGAGQILRAASAINAGVCETVLCVIGEIMDPSRWAQMMVSIPMAGAEGQFEEPFGPPGAPSGYALAAMRHAHEYGTTDEQRARVAVDQRTNACANPKAIFYGRPITIEDVLNSRMITTPFHLLEIVMPVSGAAAVVVTTEERAKTLRHPPCYILGAGECLTHSSITYSPRMTLSPVKTSAATAFQMAGVNPRDIDLVSVYDCFTITVMITLEDAGFCPKGESGPFCWETDMTYKGKLPVNTHGGQLSFGQAVLAGGMSHITEGALQIMGRGEERQVAKHDLAFVNGNGGILSEQCSLIFGSEATL